MPSGRLWAVKASKATAASGIDLSGRAPHGERAAAELEVLLGRLHLVGGDRAGLVDHLVERHVDGDAADGQRARAVGVEPERADRGVGVQHLDVVGVDAEPVGHDHRPGGLVALAVRRGAGDDLHLVGRQRPAPWPLPAAGRVVERGRAPATAPGRTSRSRTRRRCRGRLVAAGDAAALLLGPHAVVADHLERLRRAPPSWSPES